MNLYGRESRILVHRGSQGTHLMVDCPFLWQLWIERRCSWASFERRDGDRWNRQYTVRREIMFWKFFSWVRNPKRAVQWDLVGLFVEENISSFWQKFWNEWLLTVWFLFFSFLMMKEYRPHGEPTHQFNDTVAISMTLSAKHAVRGFL